MIIVVYTTYGRREEAVEVAYETACELMEENDEEIVSTWSCKNEITAIQLSESIINIIDTYQANNLSEPIECDYAIFDENLSLGTYYNIIPSISNQDEISIF